MIVGDDGVFTFTVLCETVYKLEGKKDKLYTTI